MFGKKKAPIVEKIEPVIEPVPKTIQYPVIEPVPEPVILSTGLSVVLADGRNGSIDAVDFDNELALVKTSPKLREWVAFNDMTVA